jgi:hypothetical protein
MYGYKIPEAIIYWLEVLVAKLDGIVGHVAIIQCIYNPGAGVIRTKKHARPLGVVVRSWVR